MKTFALSALVSLSAVLSLAACGASSSHQSAEEPLMGVGQKVEGLDLSQVPVAAQEGPALTATPLPKCKTGQRTYTGYGTSCPTRNQYLDIAYSLCQLSGETFIGAEVISRSCVGNPQNTFFSYTLTYRCYRPEPCTPN